MLLSLLSKRSLDSDSRDAYGFLVRPQHLQQYREYAHIYKQEERERLGKWKSFLEQQVESSVTHPSNEEHIRTSDSEVTRKQSDDARELREGGDDSKEVPASDCGKEKESSVVRMWGEISPTLSDIDYIMRGRVKKSQKSIKDVQITTTHENLPSVLEERHSRSNSEMENEEECFENEMVDNNVNTSTTERNASDSVSVDTSFPWKELEFLVHGGVPRDLRGEVWQAFVGVRARRVERYYQRLLASGGDGGDNQKHDSSLSGEESMRRRGGERVGVPEKYRKQIEKDLPRTFPGHPALDESGRNSLRRVLLAYAQHNPSVGYCQAMNFFAGILLLMMPEENAFWTLVGILDDYFDGCYTQEMIESQVDQLVFEELVRERFPKLVNHLDYLGVQVTWISGPWFLSIFVNILPWESVLRVWDVVLFEGNRVMLFRTALALMELYGPTVVTTKDAGDAITSLQSLTGSTYDSSQLVLTACMGFSNVTEERLQVLREKHRPSVVAVLEERSKGVEVWKDPKGLATKLCSFKHNSGSVREETKADERSGDKTIHPDISHSNSDPANSNETSNDLPTDSEIESLPDLPDQIVWLKAEICQMLEEKRAAELRAEELETAFMEMVKEDNRRQLSAKIEELEQEVAELRETLADRKEQEKAMLQVLMRVEQEQKVTEDARIAAEQDAAAQRYAVHVLQEKYEKAMAAFAQMEKRVVMAESMLEATLQYESGQNKALSSPGPIRPDSPQETPIKRGLLSFGLGWRDRSKAKQSNKPASGESKPANERLETSNTQMQTNGHQE